LKNLFKESNLYKIAKIIKEKPEAVMKFTCRSNYSCIISNATAILGLGDIGCEAGLPVMEGKSCLFKQLGGADVMPICIREKKIEKVVEIIRKIAPIFGMINIEDIKAPECFDVEETLAKHLDVAVFHDDQHGTAIVTLAALINSLKLAKKSVKDAKIVINGAGAAGICIAKVLHHYGAKKIISCDTEGTIYKGRAQNMNKYKEEIAEFTNLEKIKGSLADALKDADVFIGVSVPKAVNAKMIKSMKSDPIILALAEPIPEIYPEEAKKAGAFIAATGRSDFKNQVNNSLAFPGCCRGCLDIEAKKFTMEMKIAAAQALADIIKKEDLQEDYIIPGALDLRGPQKVAKAIAEAGQREGGVARKQIAPLLVEEKLRDYLIEGFLRKYDVDRKL
jgi:malic enzyme